MSDLHLIVNGRRYGGWKSIRCVRSIQSISGSFDLDVTDRWGGQEEPWPIAEEDACRVEIDGTTVIDGYVSRRSIALSGVARTLTFSGRDGAAALVDSSALLDRWTFRNASVLAIARKIAEPFGLSVSLQPGLVLPKAQRKFVVAPGDTAFAAIERAAQPAGVLVVSDGSGGLLLTRAGTARAAALVEGENIHTASVDYTADDRFSRYVVLTNVGGTDNASGPVTRVRGEATDEGVQRTERVLVIRPEAGVTAEYANRRADWEARIRAAKAESVTVGVLGWKQPDGTLWPLNALVRVRSPGIGVDGDLLISQVEHSKSEAGELSQLSLVRPDAFTPEPRAVVKSSSGARKEFAGGVR